MAATVKAIRGDNEGPLPAVVPVVPSDNVLTYIIHSVKASPALYVGQVAHQLNIDMTKDPFFAFHFDVMNKQVKLYTAFMIIYYIALAILSWGLIIGVLQPALTAVGVTIPGYVGGFVVALSGFAYPCVIVFGFLMGSTMNDMQNTKIVLLSTLLLGKTELKRREAGAVAFTSTSNPPSSVTTRTSTPATTARKYELEKGSSTAAATINEERERTSALLPPPNEEEAQLHMEEGDKKAASSSDEAKAAEEKNYSETTLPATPCARVVDWTGPVQRN
uniref:Uncharacterized protein n=1 Tax=Chromera velia CCMP2878 TaxID=1169474 RepID=A0A0G4HK69_9ALVE|eukprot:Cvel_1111.t1-p1 / transcript=Cvel_1111.t1 / gene=Cvel_1111 / organism=Chromera_velia_CCMP2878 / gene_product=hypothetical protein / transcript_product=hypothetical protein / location=Cvel_scaffold36:109307-110131(+) / protein_length=275 / sequence_SO=supercontig / SO=protein_coding / is_pseudo=false